MTRSPFISSGRQRRGSYMRRGPAGGSATRRRRRPPTLRVLGVILLAIVAALVVARRVNQDQPPSAHARNSQLSPLPAAPTPEGPRSAALILKLTGTHDPVHMHFRVPPRSGLMFNLDTGQVLWRRDPIRSLPIASLTKMMTAYLVVKSLPPYAHARITHEVLTYHGSGVGVLPRNKLVLVETLLNGLLLPSGNDAARALALRVSGSISGFVRRMNETAARLGLRCTHFASPDGYNDSGRSCAADLAVLARVDLSQPRIAKIVARRRAVMPLPIKGGKVFLYNNNPLIRLGYPGIDGLKTGYTNAAGHCLVATARRHGVWLGVVLLHSPDTGRQTRQLLDRGFRVR
jgi:D-alanyl-D-alanine carboxypeptidase